MKSDFPLAKARHAAVEATCVSTVLSPLIVCLVSGAVHTSLWLDEVTYYYFENDMGLRAAELGRSGKALVSHLGVFFYSDVQRLIHAAVRPLGLTLRRDPELYLRVSSILFFAVAVAAIYLFLRRRLRRLDALLGAMAFGSTPIFLHYAFEARVYSMTLMLVVVVLGVIDEAARRPSTGRLALASILGAVTCQSHVWTACLFAGLLLAAAVQGFGARRLTPWGRAAAAAALPALVLAVAEMLYMRATDPGAPLFPPFGRRDLGSTLWQLVFSNFTGVRLTRFIGDGPATAILQLLGGAALAGLAVVSARMRSDEPDGSRAHAWLGATAGGLALCAMLAVTYGFYMPARYSVPLMGGFLFAVARFPSRSKRLLLALLVTCNVGLLPQAIEGLGARGSMKQVAALIRENSGRDAGVVCQHLVAEGFALPAQTIVLDFYLNVLHPGAAPIPIYELPDLRATNGDHGTYRYFNGGEPLLSRMLEVPVDRFREWAGTQGRPDVWVVQPLRRVKPLEQQVATLLRLLVEEAGYKMVGQYVAPGYPASRIVHLRREPLA